MKVVCMKSFLCSVLILAGSGVIVLSKSLSIPPNADVSRGPAWKFDNEKDRDFRFQSLYDSICEMKEIELDKRIATTIRFDPASIVQFLLSIFVFANHLIGPILPENFRSRIRLQNLLSEVALHVIEIFLRLQIPAELTNQCSIFTENEIATDARGDMVRIVGTREGQQIAYSLICILNGSPTGCVLPLLIRDFPSYLKFLGISILLCSPNFGGNNMLLSFFDSLFHLRKEGRDTEGIEAAAGSDVTPSFDLSAKNSRVLVDLLSESVSMIFETFILTNSLINLSSGRKEKLNLLMVLKHILCALFTFQYISIRGRSFGSSLTSAFQDTKVLVGVQDTVRTYLEGLKNLTPERLINSVLQRKGKSSTKKSERKITVKSKGKHKNKIKKSKSTVDEY